MEKQKLSYRAVSIGGMPIDRENQEVRYFKKGHAPKQSKGYVALNDKYNCNHPKW